MVVAAVAVAVAVAVAAAVAVALAVAVAGGVVADVVVVVVVVVVVLPGPTKSAPHQGMDTRIASQVIDQLGKGLRCPLRSI